MPTISYRKGIISKGKINEVLWSQTGFIASFVGLSGYKLKKKQGCGSQDILDVILGRSEQGTDILMQEAFTFAPHHGDWKYIQPATGSEWISETKNIEGVSCQQISFTNYRLNLANRTTWRIFFLKRLMR